MFKRMDKSTGNYTVLYEVCDKDYTYTLSNLKKCGLTNEVVKYPLILAYKTTITNPNEAVLYRSTKIEELDEILGGGLSSGLYVIGANPGLGKTSLVLHILINMALNQNYSLFFNLEMSPFQIITKLLSNFSYRKSLESKDFPKIAIRDLSSRKMYNSKDNEIDKELQLLLETYHKFIDKFINVISYSDENNCKYVEMIEMALQNYEKFHNLKPIVVIDFLQLLQLKTVYNENNSIVDKPIDKRMELDKVISKLKKCSTKYNIPIILISSLSRSSYTKEEPEDYDIEYSLSVFKETSQIEYTADFIALLTRGESKANFGEEEKECINMNVLKNRYGKSGKRLSLNFISDYSYFETNN